MASGPEPADDLARLQVLLVGAVLDRQPLPGQNEAPFFADLDYVLSQERAVLSREYLRPGAVFGARVELLSPAEIVGRARQSGEFAYLRFQPPQCEARRIGLSLQLCMAFPDLDPLPLGAAVATFEPDSAGQWRTVDPTAVLAY